MSRGAEPSEAQLHEGASEPAVDTCLISAVAIRKAPSSPDDCRWPVWTRADFAAADVAARAAVKIHVTRNALNTVLLQTKRCLYFTCSAASGYEYIALESGLRGKVRTIRARYARSFACERRLQP